MPGSSSGEYVVSIDGKLPRPGPRFQLEYSTPAPSMKILRVGKMLNSADPYGCLNE